MLNWWDMKWALDLESLKKLHEMKKIKWVWRHKDWYWLLGIMTIYLEQNVDH